MFDENQSYTEHRPAGAFKRSKFVILDNVGWSLVKRSVRLGLETTCVARYVTWKECRLWRQRQHMVPLAGITRELYRISKKIHQLIIIIVYLPEQSPDYPYFTEYLPRSPFSLDRLHNFAWGFVATPCYYIVLAESSLRRAAVWRLGFVFSVFFFFFFFLSGLAGIRSPLPRSQFILDEA